MDNRIGFFEFNGEKYPIIASARALQAMADRYNLKIDKFFESYDPENIESVIFILSELLKAGHAWAKHEGEAAPVPPTFDYMMDTFTFIDITVANMAVLEGIARSLGRKIKAEKKEETAPDQQENS